MARPLGRDKGAPAVSPYDDPCMSFAMPICLWYIDVINRVLSVVDCINSWVMIKWAHVLWWFARGRSTHNRPLLCDLPCGVPHGVSYARNFMTRSDGAFWLVYSWDRSRDDLLLLLSRSSSRHHCRKQNLNKQNMNKKHQLIRPEKLVYTLIFVLVAQLMRNWSRCVILRGRNHSRALSELHISIVSL